MIDLGVVRERRSNGADYGLKVDPNALSGSYRWASSSASKSSKRCTRRRTGDSRRADRRTDAAGMQRIVRHPQGDADAGTRADFHLAQVHKVQELSDRVTVMRDGRVIDTAPNVNLDRRKLARMMVGRDVVFQPERPAVQVGEVKLSIRDVRAKNDQDLPSLKASRSRCARGKSSARRGIGQRAARTRRSDCRAAPRRPAAKFSINGKSIARASVAKRLQAGLAYIPEERNRDGIIGTFSVAENAILQNNAHYTRGGHVLQLRRDQPPRQ